MALLTTFAGMSKSHLTPEDFNYSLPDSAIAMHPADRREEAKLLHYNQGLIADHRFDEVVRILPAGSQLVLNNTKVIHARIFAHKASGGKVELFLLRPYEATHEQALSAQGYSRWWCLVGGAKKWKDGPVEAEADGLHLQAEMGPRAEEEFLIDFRWTPEERSFSEVLDTLGKIPLPPYIDREATDADAERYQTAFAEAAGSVAAPTAGLHFTKDILDSLSAEQVKLTLHVSAGTFRPMADGTISDHLMHEEACELSLESLRRLSERKPRFAVGTTALRTLESLYWLAVKAAVSGELPQHIDQHEPYRLQSPFPDFEAAMADLVVRLEREGLSRYAFETSIMIAPGYRVQSVRGLFTNFHMPKSTLILLVAALIGDDWKRVYEHALDKGYRFLSYGDSSLLMP